MIGGGGGTSSGGTRAQNFFVLTRIHLSSVSKLAPKFLVINWFAKVLKRLSLFYSNCLP